VTRVVEAEPNQVMHAERTHFPNGHRRPGVVLIWALKPDRKQLPSANDHQEGDEAYGQRLPYFGSSWLDGFSYHLPTLSNGRISAPLIRLPAKRAEH
jgi:hypothetical protein